MRIDAKDEVMTTLLTEGAFFLIAFKIPVVPMTAGSMRSFCVSVTLGSPQVRLEEITTGERNSVKNIYPRDEIGSIITEHPLEMERAGSMKHRL